MASENAQQRLIRTAEAARYLGVSKATIHHLVHVGCLPFIQYSADGPYLFDVQDLDKHIQESKQQRGGV